MTFQHQHQQAARSMGLRINEDSDIDAVDVDSMVEFYDQFFSGPTDAEIDAMFEYMDAAEAISAS